MYNCTFESNTAPDGGGAVWVDDGQANATFVGCTFVGNNNTKGNNDITRDDDTSNVTFACPNGTVGVSVTMKPGESELTNPPPAALKCTAPADEYRCINNQCAQSTTGGIPKAQCDQSCGAPTLYLCINSTCTLSATGVSKSTCEQVCK